MKEKQKPGTRKGKVGEAPKPRPVKGGPRECADQKPIVVELKSGGKGIRIVKRDVTEGYEDSKQYMNRLMATITADFLSRALERLDTREVKALSAWVKERDDAAPEAILEKLQQLFNEEEAKGASDGETIFLGKQMENAVKEKGHEWLRNMLRAFVEFRS